MLLMGWHCGNTIGLWHQQQVDYIKLACMRHKVLQFALTLRPREDFADLWMCQSLWSMAIVVLAHHLPWFSMQSRIAEAAHADGR